ncbi:ATP-binding cassette domain-containing protein [Peptoniphilus sp. MSJ-1]|uniref:ATP-binding cassette domain-containing protein n=1 Tax=Peptoniphilus ovalis TaxID=2841503 RepID=A0ABS6FI20_9FIRM|nr:ATP-binding cassette domain-containing protein [Peptoniphilus ovalis]MBU5669822.1 ATP-binding cassette domain-containing protein [Peptoniphilus ovalis]
MIKIENLEKNYSKEVKIGPIDLEIPKGGFTSIIGPNGAGKSTTLLMVGRLLDKDGGNIFIEENNIDTTKTDLLAKKIAILRQENHFVTKLTVRQLVGFGRFPYSKGRINTEDEEIISKYIDFLGLKELENRYLDELSGGQRQRVYVAMVLAQETDYVLLDEPLNNLDIRRSQEMLNHLYKITREFKKTIVTVLHDINFAAKYSDYILCMKEGQVIKFGKPEEVMRKEVLSEIFDTDIEIINGPHGPVAIY